VLELLNACETGDWRDGRLLKKRAEPLLWMEVYENVRTTPNRGATGGGRVRA